MCASRYSFNMMSWLRSQIGVLELWREELAQSADLDLSTISRLERHYQWMTSELALLEDLSQPACESAYTRQ